MNLRHLNTLLEAQAGAARITCLAWSPNNLKLAVVLNKKTIVLFDENGERRDKISAKASDKNCKVFQIQGIAFNPASNCLATGQTDNCVFVYRIGDAWGEKKALIHKFSQSSPVTCLIWPAQQQNFVFFGLMEGKVRVGDLSRNKSYTLYNTKSYVCSIVASSNGESILTGHADGSIHRYMFDSSGGGAGHSAGRVLTHTCPPYALSFASNCVLAGGCDSKLIVYDMDGRVLQNFDYSRDGSGEREFSCAATSPNGQTVVFGSFNRLRVLGWKAGPQMWEEAKAKEVENLYTVTCMSFRADGSRLALGSLCGAVELYDCCLRRTIYKNKFELTYVGVSQVIVKRLSTGARVILQSLTDSALDRIQIMGGDRYIVAYTPSTLIVGDMEEQKNSEIPFNSTGSEKFYFETEKVCMIFNAGELMLLEYGSNEILCAVRTELINPHLVSVRLNERAVRHQGDMKFMAYLVDWKTISIMNLSSCREVATLSHNVKIDWLELNETGTKLLFRDKRLKLWVYDVDSQVKTGVVSYCTYVQWVPQSDVVVAQSRSTLCVLYNIDRPDQITPLQIKGDILDLSRQNGKTQVLVSEGNTTVSYDLDEGLIEFGTAMDDGDYNRAVAFLENLELSPETIVMWRQLSDYSFADHQLAVARRCFAAMGDIDQVEYIDKVLATAEAAAIEQGGGDGMQHYDVQARLAVMGGHYQLAENLYLTQGRVDEAMQMYRSVHKWDESLAVAERESHPELDSIRSKYFETLIETGREARAAKLKEEENDLRTAAQLYLKAGLPARAAKLVISSSDLRTQSDMVERIGAALMAGGLCERAGELWESVQQFQRALEAYRKGHAYAKAVDLCRQAFPNEVIQLEEDWGDHLCHIKKMDAAIPHYIEAGRNVKAVEAALHAKQWHKAVLILNTLDADVANRYYIQVADAYSSIRDFNLAEKYYVQGGQPRKAFDMYTHSNRWYEAHKVADACNLLDDVQGTFIAQADTLAGQGRFKEAEKLYITVNSPELAIAMYKRAKKYDKVMRLIKHYHPETVADTHGLLAEEIEADKHFNVAEQHFVKSGENGWKKAIQMYCRNEMWEDSHRVAREHGGEEGGNQLVYRWAKHLGGDSAIKLLTKFNLLESSIDFACDNQHFDFAFDIAKMAVKSKLGSVHCKYGNILEDEGKYDEAAEHFITGGQPKEAVLMYVHSRDWEAAQRVAEEHHPESLTDVLLGQGRNAFEAKEYTKSEAFLLRAQRPDMVVKYYKGAGMWQDALRVAKEYMPKKALAQLQKEYDQFMNAQGPRSAEEMLAPAQAWEQSGDHEQAIQAYLKITSEHTPDTSLLLQVWTKAAELAVKFMPDSAKGVSMIVAERLAGVELYQEAAEYYLQVEDYRQAIDMFIQVENWKKARRVAKKLAPDLMEYVDQAHGQFLEQKGDAKALVNVDAIAGLDMLATQGEWEQCIEMAKQKGSAVHEKYVARFAAHLILEQNKPTSALTLFKKEGAPPKPQNFKCYEEMARGILGQAMNTSYRIVADLRDVLLTVIQNIPSNVKLSYEAQVKTLHTYLRIAHYFALRCACLSQVGLQAISLKLTTAMVRYTDLLAADRKYWEAGKKLREAGQDGMAFVFFNRLLDICDVIDGTLDQLSPTDDFDETDIPEEVSLPSTSCLTKEERSEISDWVVSVSTEQTVTQALALDDRGVYEASLLNATTGQADLACIITGYPVIKQQVEFNNQLGLVADKDHWNKFVMQTKLTHSPECQDVVQFIKRWCGSSTSTSFKFK
ncbi:intraflagellar transport protein 172 homolog [Sycon ciliatum]|uniref:intraflagellar transport protein 172 homolog n=1 Tax=Sycon ciliatum TaxID=27933 RepID=UPI0031F6733D